MNEMLKEILEINGVNGALILTNEGQIIFKEMKSNISIKTDGLDWNSIVGVISTFKELELVFEKGLIYARKLEYGFLMVFVELVVQIAMIRLNCDIILPTLQALPTNKKYKKLFKK